MIHIDSKSKCCGCGACSCICPKGCIEMKTDDEGFCYPDIDVKSCIDCGLCEKICPIINRKQESDKEQTGYVAQIKDRQIRNESTSGGIFSAIAMYVLKQRGVVFGAAWDDKFVCKHIRVDKEEELWRFRNSKYVQSDTNGIFKVVKEDLVSGKLVCFSGTPCQIEGLKFFLEKEYSNLILVDVVCRSVPSPLVWKKYFNYLQSKIIKEIDSIKFREKLYGYKYSALVVRNKEHEILYAEGIDTDPYLRAFFSDISVRPSCYECQFKKRYRESDITLWDCYTVNEFDKKMDDDTGVTRVLTHSQKGELIIEAVKDGLVFTRIDPDCLVKNVKEMVGAVTENVNRNEFFKDLNNLSEYGFFNKWFPITLKTKVEKYIRLFCVRTGIYKAANRMYKKIRKERRKR